MGVVSPILALTANSVARAILPQKFLAILSEAAVENSISEDSTMYAAKIIQISNDYDFLNKIEVDDQGNICDFTSKVFQESILNKKWKIGERNKKKKHSAKKQRLDIENETAAIEPLYHSPKTTHVPATDIKPSSSREVAQISELEEEEEIIPTLNSNENTINNDDIGALHTFIPNDVTLRDVKIFKSILKGMERAHHYQKQQNPLLSKETKLSDYYNTPGEEKKEIWPGCDIFLPIETLTEIERSSKSSGVFNWKTCTKLILLEIYGDAIQNYSAQGKRHSIHPGIDRKLFQATYAWIQSMNEEEIPLTNFISEINNIAGRRRNKVFNKTDVNKMTTQPDEISESNLQFFKKIVLAVERNVEWHEKSEVSSHQIEELPDHFYVPGPNKNKIAAEYEIYFPKETISYIEKRTHLEPGKSNWRLLVREALLEVYGGKIAYFSAKGTRSGHPSIDPQLFKAIYAWASSRSNEVIEIKDYIDHINKVAYNKRKYIKQKTTSTIVKEANVTI